jgi:CDP-6-deoxy-D-xylo-4-hexulose-3-dehydrase
MHKPKVLYSAPFFNGDEIKAAISCLEQGGWLPSGPNVAKFEREFSKKFGFDESLMVNSGSSANLVMIAALKKYFGWADGSEIIVSVVGFPTTVAPILQNNMVPRFIDIEWESLNWDLAQVEAAINEKTVAVFSSPVLGNPYDIDRLAEICDKAGIKMIADGCDSLGSKWKGKWLSDYFVSSSCSFYPAHHITTMEGGMVSSSLPGFNKLARSFAWWGRDCYCVGECNLLTNGTCGNRFDKWLDDYDAPVDHKYVFSNIGYNLKPLDLQGSVGLVQLAKFDEVHEKRRANYKRIKDILSVSPSSIRVVEEMEGAETSWFGVPIICSRPSLKHAMQQYFEQNGVQTRNYFAGNLLLHPGYKHLGNAKDFPNAYEVLNKVFFLGCHPGLTEEHLQWMEKVFNDFVSTNGIVADGYSWDIAV